MIDCTTSNDNKVSRKTMTHKNDDTEDSDNDKITDDVVARARDIRETMSRHIGQGTVCEAADDLLKQGAAAYDELESLLHVRQSKREELEQKYSTSNCSDDRVIDKITSAASQVAKMTGEVALWKNTVPSPPEASPEPRPFKNCSGSGCCGRKALFRRHRLV